MFGPSNYRIKPAASDARILLVRDNVKEKQATVAWSFIFPF